MVKDEFGNTPLLKALIGERSIVKAMAAINAATPEELDEPNTSGMTPLKAAVMYLGVDGVKCLIHKGATVDPELLLFAQQHRPSTSMAVSVIRNAVPKDNTIFLLYEDFGHEGLAVYGIFDDLQKACEAGKQKGAEYSPTIAEVEINSLAYLNQERDTAFKVTYDLDGKRSVYP